MIERVTVGQNELERKTNENERVNGWTHEWINELVSETEGTHSDSAGKNEK